MEFEPPFVTYSIFSSPDRATQFDFSRDLACLQIHDGDGVMFEVDGRQAIPLRIDRHSRNQQSIAAARAGFVAQQNGRCLPPSTARLFREHVYAVARSAGHVKL